MYAFAIFFENAIAGTTGPDAWLNDRLW